MSVRFGMKKSILFFCSLTFMFSLISVSFAELETYETPAILQAKDVVPKNLLVSDLYTIENDVITRGYTTTYRIDSKFGKFVAHGDDMLKQRIHEIKVIDELDKLRKSKKFASGVAKGVKTPFVFVKNLVTHPVNTITGVPKGLWRYGSRVGEMTKGEKSEYEDGFAKELILFAEQKRKLAYELKVDVYSSNKVLQEHLNSVSWASYSGGAAITAAFAQFAPVVGYTGTAQNIDNLIRDNAPEDLNKINRKLLKQLGVDKDDIKGFLGNQWLSPRHRTSIAHGLEDLGLKGGISEFIRHVNTAESEEDAFFFENIVKLIGHYIADTVESEVSIVVLDNFTLLKVRKHYVFPLLIDHGYWTAFSENVINRISTSVRSEAEGGVEILLWITGTVSDRVKKELKAHQIILVENAYSALSK